jgi:tetratricopeptide (TPR) repeat protein
MAAACLALASGCKPQASADPAEAIKAGWDNYRMGEFNQAVKAFESAQAATQPGDPLYAQAVYALATTWNLRGNPDDDPARARQLYEKVLQEAPKSDEAAWSLLAMARMKQLVPADQEPDYPAVRQAYQEVIDRFPEHLAAHEAFVHQQATWLTTLRPEDAQAVVDNVDKFVAAHPKSPFLNAVYSVQSCAYGILKQGEKHLQAELNALKYRELDPTNPNMDNALTYWVIASIAEFECGDFVTARKFYRRLVDEYPAEQRVYGARVALKRMDDLEAKMRKELGLPAAGGGP